jgi:hypothetical protein
LLRPLLLAALLLALPGALAAQQFGGPRRIEVPMGYPYTAVGKWTYSGGGARGTCTAFFVNTCTVVTAGRCTFGKASAKFRFEASDGRKFKATNIRVVPGEADDAQKLSVAFAQLADSSNHMLAEQSYGRFAFDKADNVAAIAGLTPHCSYGFSYNKEGKDGRGTLDPDVYVWGPLRQVLKDKVRSDEYFLHMINGAFGTSGSPIFRCTPRIVDGKVEGVDVTPPARLVGIHVRLNNDNDDEKFADRLRVDPRHMAIGIGSQQFYSELLDYVKENPCPSR